ncbi:MAG: crossover junction endodeoxyribonuclease RuvC [Minisyncoccia bacterium]
MIILGIDPGYERLGIAIIEKTDNKEALVYSDTFKTSAKETHSERLNQIGAEVQKIIKKFKPEVLAIETLFFETNAKTAMKVAEARGVLIYEAKKNNLLVREFTPMEIKVAVTGYGKSDKKQMAYMIDKLIKIDKKIKHDDEYDAIAAGLTAFAIKNS